MVYVPTRSPVIGQLPLFVAPLYLTSASTPLENALKFTCAESPLPICDADWSVHVGATIRRRSPRFDRPRWTVIVPFARVATCVPIVNYAVIQNRQVVSRFTIPMTTD